MHVCSFCHANLLPLLGYCCDPPALVYPLMINISLFHQLHEVCAHILNIMHAWTNNLCTQTEKSPSWKQRVHILLGVSEGLLYLHPMFLHLNLTS